MKQYQERLCENEERTVWEWLELTGDVNDEAESGIALGLLEERKSITYPNLYRGAFLLIAWGHLEDTIRAVTELLRSELNVDRSLSKKRGESFVNAANRYFEESLGLCLAQEASDVANLNALLAVRNSFAHYGGIAKKSKREQFKAWEGDGIGSAYDDLRDTLVLSLDYVKQVNYRVANVMSRPADRSEQVVNARLHQ